MLGVTALNPVVKIGEMQTVGSVDGMALSQAGQGGCLISDGFKERARVHPLLWCQLALARVLQRLIRLSLA